MMSETPLELEDVTKCFGDVSAVSGISFKLAAGDIFGLLGPNGAGKTTILRMILDILRPDSGRIRLYGTGLSDANRRWIGYLPEERGLYVRQKIGPMLEYFGILKGLSPSEAMQRTAECLESLNIADAYHKKIKMLSKGNQQKIQMALAFLSNPKIVIMDEPFMGFDPINTQMVINLIRSHVRSGNAVILSTHQMSMVEQLCNKIMMIHHGREVLNGDLDKIKEAFSDRVITVKTDADLGECGLIQHDDHNAGLHHLTLRSGATSTELLKWIIDRGGEIRIFKHDKISLDEIFISTVERHKDG
jgi:ABC-2 type transport system ATP-binding protein